MFGIPEFKSGFWNQIAIFFDPGISGSRNSGKFYTLKSLDLRNTLNPALLEMYCPL